MDMEELFKNGCFSPQWTEQKVVYQKDVPIPNKKDLNTLLEELAEIKENIDTLQEKQWYLARLIQYHKNGFLKN